MQQQCLMAALTRRGLMTGRRGRGPAGHLPFLLVCMSVVLLLPGCKRASKVDATADLVSSFEGSPSQADVTKAKAAFDEGRYRDSLLLLHKVASRGNLTEAQKKAMAGIVGRLLQVTQDDPKLAADTQIHKLMEALVLMTLGRT